MFQEHVLNAHDICNNCMGRRRREALRPRKHATDEEYYERVRWRTSVENTPATVVADSRRVFCKCGVDSAYTRIWEDEDVDRDRFKRMLKRLLDTLDEVAAVAVDHQRVAAHALDAFDRIPEADTHGPFRETRPLTIYEALAAGVEQAAHIDPPSSATRTPA